MSTGVGCPGAVSQQELAVLEQCVNRSWLSWSSESTGVGCPGAVSQQELAVLEH